MVDGRGELLFLWARDDDGFGNDAAFSGVGSLWPEAVAAKIDHYLASFGGGRRCPRATHIASNPAVHILR